MAGFMDISWYFGCDMKNSKKSYCYIKLWMCISYNNITFLNLGWMDGLDM